MPVLTLPALTLDGTSEALIYTPAELEQFYIPLARELLRRAGEAPRFIVGIGGPPGCGKSAFTALLAAVSCALAGSPVAAAVGLDGWHYPNAYLDTHTILRDGIEIPLRKVKGSPPSFDTQSALQFLQVIRRQPSGAYPVYSRARHDPIPNLGQIDASQRLILIEGNYLLLDQPPWDHFQAQFDLTLSLTAPRALLVQALRERHLRGGKDPLSVEQHLTFSDLGNLDLVIEHSRRADIRIEKSDSRVIQQIIFPEIRR